jgi:REP-associated tyrosine transposase
MPRRLRIFEPGAYYHLAARGNNGERIVRDDLDCLDFLRRLSRVVFEQNWRVVTYCLMTNHYHLLMRPAEQGFAAGVQLLNCGHARTMNRKHGRTGHLFRNHYSWWPVESDEHLLEAVRYVVLNPVRAGICTSPDQWRWSSYRAAVDLEHPSDFLALGDLLCLFGATPAKARVAFRDFVAAGHGSVSDTRPWDDVTRPTPPWSNGPDGLDRDQPRH